MSRSRLPRIALSLAALVVLVPTASCSGHRAAPVPRASPDETGAQPARQAPATTATATATAAPAERRYTVFDGATPVLDVGSTPGALLSTAHPPPGQQPPAHPFLNGQARSTVHESRLRALLEASTSFDDFVARLRAAGLRVEPWPGP